MKKILLALLSCLLLAGCGNQESISNDNIEFEIDCENLAENGYEEIAGLAYCKLDYSSEKPLCYIQYESNYPQSAFYLMGSLMEELNYGCDFLIIWDGKEYALNDETAENYDEAFPKEWKDTIEKSQDIGIDNLVTKAVADSIDESVKMFCEKNIKLEEGGKISEETSTIDGFLCANANYEKYNSYASENGLEGTLIYIEGKVINQTKFDSDSELPCLALVVEQEDGNRWCVQVFSDVEIDEIGDKKVRIYGTYMGFSDVMNLPGMVVYADDIDKLEKANIEIDENGTYKTIWSCYDYALNCIDEQKNEKEITNNEENIYIPTKGEENALKKAESYLEIMAFSRNGLIEQLEYEKFSHEEAIYGADNCGADWNEQAAKKAKSYLDIMSFSKDGLIEQLEFEGFTHEQAVYGVEQNGY